jgi:carotenoid cleavage dioxygenase
MPEVENRYLEGNFAPVADEVTAFDLPVEGAIPPELSGQFLRIGPNPITAPDPATYHWFTGHGMVHGVQLGDGRAQWYRNRWVRTDPVAEELGEEPVEGPKPKIFDSSNTNVLAFAGQTLALTEMCIPYELTAELGTVARTDFGGPLTNGFTAHPKVDPVTGDLHGFGYGIEPPFLVYHVIDPSGRLVRSEPITLPGATMMHDFAITERHVVFLDLPVVFSWDALAAGQSFPFRWTPDHGARVGVMPREGTDADVRWFDVELCYVFHPLNAYDLVDADGDAESVVVDVVRYETVFRTDLLGPGEIAPTLDRWTIDLRAGKVLEERVDDRAQEFPRADPRLTGRRHRYGFSAALRLEGDAGRFDGDRVLKHDFVAGTTVEADLGAGRTASEAVFVPAGPSAGEDEGWLLDYVHDAGRDSSDLVILDAHDFGGPPVATIALPQRVPFGFHGNWVPDPM